MLLDFKVLLAIAATFNKVTSSYPIKKEDIICPDANPLNCYPRLFEPEAYWKPVLEGQMIPHGLDIRMNIDTLEKEAKLSDPGSTDENPDVVLVDHDQETLGEGLDAQQHKINKIENKLKNRRKSKNSIASDNDFNGSMDYVVLYASSDSHQQDFDTLMEHLEVLSELSSDLDFGIEVMQNLQSILKLTGLYGSDSLKNLSKGQVGKVEEISTRILSASLRNNLLAQELFKAYFFKPAEILEKLAEVKMNERISDILIKRRLGLLSALMMNGAFENEVVESALKEKLIDLYDLVQDDDIKAKILQILSDIGFARLGKRSLADKQELEEPQERMKASSLDAEYAYHIQKMISQSESASHPNTKKLLDRLKALKLNNKGLFKATPDLLNWLSEQIDIHKEDSLEKREIPEDGIIENNRYVDYLISLRHEVFGNKNAMRKYYSEET